MVFKFIRNAIFGSSAEAHHRPEKPFKAHPQPPPRIKLTSSDRAPSSSSDFLTARRSMSPASRVRKWRERNATPSASKQRPVPRRKKYPATPSSMSKAANSLPSSSRFGTPEPGDVLETVEEGIDGSTLFDIDEDNDVTMYNANDDTLVETEDGYDALNKTTFNTQDELERQAEQAEEMRRTGCSEDAIALYQKLSMRGKEPLLPKTWDLDFDALPDALFSEYDDHVFIKESFGEEFRAISALKALIHLGPRVRDAMSPHQSPSSRTAEVLIRRAILAYIKWSYHDGQLDAASIPLLALEAGPRSMPASKLHNRMLVKLRRLEGRWHEARGTSLSPFMLPTLYGVIISHTVIALGAYDLQSGEPTLRPIAMFDYGQRDYDVWNSLAIAILVVHCRNNLMELRKCLGNVPVSADSFDQDA